MMEARENREEEVMNRLRVKNRKDHEKNSVKPCSYKPKSHKSPKSLC